MSPEATVVEKSRRGLFRDIFRGNPEDPRRNPWRVRRISPACSSTRRCFDAAGWEMS